MSIALLVLICFFLSIDSFVTVLARSTALGSMPMGRAFKMGLSFGLGEAVMATIGWLLAVQFSSWITGIDHWISFILLCGIGGHMIWEGVAADRSSKTGGSDQETSEKKGVLLTVIGSSVDSAAFGVSLAFMNLSLNTIVTGLLSLGAIVCIMATLAAWLGRRMGVLLGKWAEIAGGAVLIGIGTYIWFTHTFMGVT